jgi:hypothetical protein
MNLYTAPGDFMAGIYVMRFDTKEAAGEFVLRFSACPVWPIMARGLRANEVVVLALELAAQAHGDFSQEGNTLALNPHLLGAREVSFCRDDALLALFSVHTLETGYADAVPCGSDCEHCPSFGNPCRGCPAYYRYDE